MRILSYSAPYWATPQPIELRRTITEIRRTLLSYAAPKFDKSILAYIENKLKATKRLRQKYFAKLNKNLDPI
jgi:hypothetical protein